MDQLTEMRVFVRAIERGAFASAAKDLGLTPSAVSKLVARLESRLGVRLVNRTTRRLSLTAEGETYFESGRRLVDAVDSLESDVAASSGWPRGLLRVNTNFAFGTYQLAPALADFNRLYPDVRLDLSVTERVVDLNAEQVDVAIRTGVPRDSSFMMRKIGETRRIICGSPRYLEQFGVPKSPSELTRHSCIIFRSGTTFDRWPFKAGSGETEEVTVTGPIVTDSPACALELVRQGAGLMRIGELLVSDAVRRGELVPLLVERHDPEPWTVSAVFAPQTQKVRRIRVFLDFLVEKFGGSPWRLAPAELRKFAPGG
jgi:DNA-binding transcriptional LysR family regulator